MALFDNDHINHGDTVIMEGDITTGLLAVTGVLPLNGLTCVSYTSSRANESGFLVDTSDVNSGTKDCVPEFSIFMNGVCVT